MLSTFDRIFRRHSDGVVRQANGVHTQTDSLHIQTYCIDWHTNSPDSQMDSLDNETCLEHSDSQMKSQAGSLNRREEILQTIHIEMGCRTVFVLRENHQPCLRKNFSWCIFCLNWYGSDGLLHPWLATKGSHNDWR